MIENEVHDFAMTNITDYRKGPEYQQMKIHIKTHSPKNRETHRHKWSLERGTFVTNEWLAARVNKLYQLISAEWPWHTSQYFVSKMQK